MIVKPKIRIQPCKPSPQLAQAIQQREQLRPRSIQEQIQDIRTQIKILRCATYLLLLRI